MTQNTTANPAAPAERRVVMLVDDDWMNRELMQNFLERAGFRALHANSGEKALAMAAESQPALILCDVRMSGMDGVEVCAALKSQPATAAIPIIILTAYEDEEERARALGAGADAFVSKMAGWGGVIDHIQRLIG